MNKKIIVLLVILTFLLLSNYILAHEKKHSIKQTVVTDTAASILSDSTAKESTGLIRTTQTSVIPYSEKEKKLIAKIEKRKKFRKSLIPITIAANILVGIFVIGTIIDIRRKNKV